MILRPAASIAPSEITPASEYFNRRRFLGAAGAAAAALHLPSAALAAPAAGSLFKSPSKSAFSTDEAQTPFAEATTKTRFRELEEDIAKNAEQFNPHPWKVSVEGECLKPGVFDMDDLLTLAPMEERIYRMLCTEGWSHVVPYIGYPLAELLKRVQPTGNAKYIEFTSIHDPAHLKGQRDVTYISWPYVEGLRMDEAMHPLTIIALGAYGQALPKGLGAPLAVRVPWKYGTKSPKSVVKIRLTQQQPLVVWVKHYPQTSSFWRNVNPDVSPSIWRSRATERRAGELTRRPTLPFNGYAAQVASLYQGMDPKDLY